MKDLLNIFLMFEAGSETGKICSVHEENKK